MHIIYANKNVVVGIRMIDGCILLEKFYARIKGKSVFIHINKTVKNIRNEIFVPLLVLFTYNIYFIESIFGNWKDLRLNLETKTNILPSVYRRQCHCFLKWFYTTILTHLYWRSLKISLYIIILLLRILYRFSKGEA